MHSNWVFATEADPVTGLQSDRRCRPGQHVQQDDRQDQPPLAAGGRPAGARFVRHGLPGAGPDATSRARWPSTARRRTRIRARSRVRPAVCPAARSTTCWLGPNGLSGEAGLKPETSTQWTAGFALGGVQGLLDRRRSVERGDQEPGAVAGHRRAGRVRQSAAIRGPVHQSVPRPGRLHDHRVRAASVQRRSGDLPGRRLGRHLRGTDIAGASSART